MIIKQITAKDHPVGFMVEVTKGEAIKLIKSLAAQMDVGSANQQRIEFTSSMTDTSNNDLPTKDHYFSIAVDTNKD